MLLDQLIFQSGGTLAAVMSRLNQNAQGICFILEERKLIGVVTDGDIRRAVLAGSKLDDQIDSVMNRNFFSLPIDSTFITIQKNLAKFSYIPILNDSGDIVDLATSTSYHQIPLINPVFDGNELEYVTDCINSGWISSQGKYVVKFEEKFGHYVGNPNTLAVSNGTVALHLALVSLGVGLGDEVLVPNLTFAASVNAVLYVGATPVLVDVDPLTMAIDINLASSAITDRTKAIIPVHLYGHPAELAEVMVLAEKHNLYVVEDCAEALGSRYLGKHVGNFGDVATFSFFGNKTITTGEGGMLVFQNSEIRDRAKILRDHGMSAERRYWHDEVGYNYRLTNLQAAVGVAQMERVEYFVEKKRWIAQQYNSRFCGVNCLQLPVEIVGSLNSYWIYTLVLLDRYASRRNELIELLKQYGIESRPVFTPMHRMPPYIKYASLGESYAISNSLSDGGISLPSSINITDSEIQRICDLFLSHLDCKPF